MESGFIFFRIESGFVIGIVFVSCFEFSYIDFVDGVGDIVEFSIFGVY